MSNFFVIKKNALRVNFIVILLVSLVLSLVIWFFMNQSYFNFVKNKLEQDKLSYDLRMSNHSLNLENKKLKEEFVKIRKLEEIDKKAAVRLQKNIRSFQKEVFRLKEELKFYDVVMTETTGSSGLSIQGLHIEPTEQKQAFLFKLILTNVANKNNKPINAALELSIEGKENKEVQIISVDDLKKNNSFNKNIKFKNFIRIEDEVHFPKGFTPSKVIVKLRNKNKKNSVQRIFKWSVKNSD